MFYSRPIKSHMITSGVMTGAPQVVIGS
ncbi:BnaC04g36510D [Brassica napus]|uniref:BnaC04g36510D protein n=1 Tax=Brassica napus TaxID=3708 RepID=A0A078G171_BRANA|nr:BnaC04g36510D [Brassica napus]